MQLNSKAEPYTTEESVHPLDYYREEWELDQIKRVIRNRWSLVVLVLLVTFSTAQELYGVGNDLSFVLFDAIPIIP